MNTNYTSHAQTHHIPTTYTLHTTQEPSPASSASPTSPRMNEYLQHAPNPARQLRPLKSPLYVPAVLRPNDYYSQAPMTPPKSMQGSLDSLAKDNEDAITAAQRELDLALQHSFASGAEQLSVVTGPPSKDHWRPDEASANCDSPTCRSSFNLFVRKHHCRHCGHIFCSSHVTYTIPLDQNAKFHPDGVLSRACDTCHRQYQRWDTARSVRRKNSDNGSGSTTSSSGSEAGHLTPVVAQPSGRHRRMISVQGGNGKFSQHRHPAQQQQPQQPAVANSVPKDWAWSTF